MNPCHEVLSVYRTYPSSAALSTASRSSPNTSVHILQISLGRRSRTSGRLVATSRAMPIAASFRCLGSYILSNCIRSDKPTCDHDHLLVPTNHSEHPSTAAPRKRSRPARTATSSVQTIDCPQWQSGKARVCIASTQSTTSSDTMSSPFKTITERSSLSPR